MYENLLPVLVMGYGRMGKLYVKQLLAAGIPPGDIIVVDTDGNRMFECAQQYPRMTIGALPDALSRCPKVALVLTNSPAHLVALEALRGTSVRHVYVEKPTVLSHQLNGLRRLTDVFDTFVTGYLINFSPAVSALALIMQSQKLDLYQGSARWCSDRTGDKRPTAGDVQDELTHSAELLFMLTRLTQRIERVNVCSFLDYVPLMNEAVQKAAHERDATYPLHPESSAQVGVVVRTSTGTSIRLMLQSSFVAFDRERRVEMILAYQGYPVAKAQLLFDTNGSDVLSVANLGVQHPERSVFAADAKIHNQLRAFLDKAAGHESDHRLTGFLHSLEAVRFNQLVYDANFRV